MDKLSIIQLSIIQLSMISNYPWYLTIQLSMIFNYPWYLSIHGIQVPGYKKKVVFTHPYLEALYILTSLPTKNQINVKLFKKSNQISLLSSHQELKLKPFGVSLSIDIIVLGRRLFT